MKKRLVGVTEFKANYSAFLDEAERGGSVTILKKGRPVAILEPAPNTAGTTRHMPMPAKPPSGGKK